MDQGPADAHQGEENQCTGKYIAGAEYQVKALQVTLQPIKQEPKEFNATALETLPACVVENDARAGAGKVEVKVTVEAELSPRDELFAAQDELAALGVAIRALERNEARSPSEEADLKQKKIHSYTLKKRVKQLKEAHDNAKVDKKTAKRHDDDATALNMDSPSASGHVNNTQPSRAARKPAKDRASHAASSSKRKRARASSPLRGGKKAKRNVEPKAEDRPRLRDLVMKRRVDKIAGNFEEEVAKRKAEAQKQAEANPSDVDIELFDGDMRALRQDKVAIGESKLRAFYELKGGIEVEGDQADDTAHVGKKLKWHVAGMRTKLYSHQLHAVGFMVGREKSRSAVKVPGGILADAMGLGKTLEVMGCIVAHLSPKKAAVPTTLLVVPANLQAQWEDALREHCPSMTYCVFSNKSGGLSRSGLKDYDVVLATYNNLISHYSKPSSQSGPKINMFETEWHRIILDEAHIIKNPHTKAAKMAFELKGKYKWVVTATPTPNTTDEYFPYFKFLGVPDCESWPGFSEHYLKPVEAAVQDSKKPKNNLEQLLLKIQLRRTTTANFLNESVFTLPVAEILEAKVMKFTEEEAVVYGWVRDRLAERVLQGAIHDKSGSTKHAVAKTPPPGDDASEEGLLAKAGIHKAVMRLRQVADHPFLLGGLLGSVIVSDDIRSMRSALPVGVETTPVLDMLERWFRRQGQASSLTPSPFSLAVSEPKCQWCCKLPKGIARQAECGHICCEVCFSGFVSFQVTLQGPDYVPDCIRCEKSMGQVKPFEMTSDFEEEIQREPSRLRPASGRAGRRRGDDTNNAQPRQRKDSAVDLLAEADRIPGKPLLMSPKLRAVVELVQQWQDEAAEDKIIIFFEWIGMARVIGRKMQDLGIDFVYYSGEQSQGSKDRAVEAFTKKASVKVMIASLKSTSHGLNLTCANRVIIVDLWWNRAQEEQAFGRVYRINQKKLTYFIRVLVEDTVDDDILKIQEDKLRELESTGREFNSKEDLMHDQHWLDVMGLSDRVHIDEDGRYRIGNGKNPANKKGEARAADDSEDDDDQEDLSSSEYVEGSEGSSYEDGSNN